MSTFAFLHPALLGIGLHVAAARVRRAVLGHRRYAGTAQDILRAGLEDCWSGRYLTASPGHYRQFWTRDIGFAAASLVRLGGPWPDRLLLSLDWAIQIWRARGSHVTTTINPLLRWPADVFDYGVDSLPLLLAALRALTEAQDVDVAARSRALVDRHRDWIAVEVDHFVDRVVDPATGLVRADRAFSAHRDTFRNSSTAYANTMVALLARTVAETGWATDRLGHSFAAAGPGDGVGLLPAPMTVTGIECRLPPGRPALDRHPMQVTRIARESSTPDPDALGASATGASATGANVARDWGVLLRRHFWLGDRFRDRLGSDETSGEANVWPFFTGLIDDAGMQRTALETLRREGYTKPVALRFEATHDTNGLLAAYRLWSPDYQTTTSWTSLGSIYLALLREVDPPAAADAVAAMRALIERDGTSWEVIDRAGLPWRSGLGLSISDQSMLWGAILLEVLKLDHGPPIRTG